MNFIEQKRDNVLIETINISRATLKEAEDFKNMLIKAIDEGERKIIVDFSQCDFVDSTFLGGLVVSLKRMTAVKGDIRLVGFRPPVRSMFELTRMHKVFEAFESVEDAVNSFASK
ncbi:MAG: STAS domain-containing protein [Ignavibacteria bacterium]|nr:STAS domain-containing protein [Ignavibacteria bacterium]